jgi:23S rRNA (cytosine1962-C5)-methyltransferase
MSVAQIVIKPRRALPFFSRHPWVFEGAIGRVEGSPAPGDAVRVISSDGEFIAWGLFNPASAIRVRLYSWKDDAPLDEQFWSNRLDAAIALRRQVLGDLTSETGCRLVFSEADGLSGMTVDRHGDWLLVQWTSRAMADREALLISLLQQKLAPRGIWRRTEKGMADAEGLEARDGLISGELPPRPLILREGDIQFAIDVVEGQKTGFYYDQRDNRRSAARYARDARVLDAFCYSGGFGLSALRYGGAREVTAIDSSAGALELARRNAEFNGLADRMTFVQGDCYKELEKLGEAGEIYDLVILDPPRMTRSRSGLTAALRGYHSLNRLGLRLLRPGGILVTCSCSGLVDRAMYEEMLAGVALDADRRLVVLESHGAAADHPLNLHCPENSYLKCYVIRAD